MHPVAHEEEWVAVDEALRVVVEVVLYEMQEERYDGQRVQVEGGF